MDEEQSKNGCTELSKLLFYPIYLAWLFKQQTFEWTFSPKV